LEEVRKKLVECTGPKEVISHILQLRHDQKLRSISLLWWRWKDRNRIVAGEKGNSEDQLLHLISETADEFEQFFTKVSEKPCQNWVTPSEDELKMNIDGGFSAYRTGGWGFVVRNVNGEAVAAGAGSLPFVYDALQAEAIACLTGIQWSSYWGIRRFRWRRTLKNWYKPLRQMLTTCL
jgi:hypothetical protein